LKNSITVLGWSDAVLGVEDGSGAAAAVSDIFAGDDSGPTLDDGVVDPVPIPHEYIPKKEDRINIVIFICPERVGKLPLNYQVFIFA
jgi:hypothetical protein